MPHYRIRRVQRGSITRKRHTPTLQVAIDERVIIFSGISLRQRLVIARNLLRGGMTIVEAP